MLTMLNPANRFLPQWISLPAAFGIAIVFGIGGHTAQAQDPSDDTKVVKPIETEASESGSTEAGSTEARPPKSESQTAPQKTKTAVSLIVLGTAQDAGFPQSGCGRQCCHAAWSDHNLRRHATSIAIVDHQSSQRWLFECTPDFPDQLRILDEYTSGLSEFKQPQKNSKTPLDGIFLTHAHIGHYTGLIHLGREVMGASDVPVHAMPRMNEFLKTNGPWSQLVKLNNISLSPLKNDTKVQLNKRISVRPVQVPHRDEFSETVGFIITGPNRKVLFLPDIDKWSRWETVIESVIKKVDVAFVDGTFFANGEIPGRDMALIPHPFVEESLKRFSALDATQRNKVRFIHFNHTNPVLQPDSPAARQIRNAGMQIAEQGKKLGM